MSVINVDNSTLTPVTECTTQVALKALGWRGVDTGEALDIGSVVHDALEGYFLGHDLEWCFDHAWDEYFPSERLVDKPQYQYNNVRDIFMEYCRSHPIAHLPFEILETERMVGMPLDDAGEIMFWMKRDAKVLDKVTGSIVPLDHKTTSWSIGASWQAKWRTVSQLSGYIWATQKETGEPCPFAYVNAIQINKLPDSNKKCYKHQMKYSECRLMHTEFALLTYERAEHQLKQWRKDAITLARRYQSIREGFSDLDIIKHADCFGTFNRSCDWCEFNKYCRMGKEPKYAEALLTQGRWAPWLDKGAITFDWR